LKCFLAAALFFVEEEGKSRESKRVRRRRTKRENQRHDVCCDWAWTRVNRVKSWSEGHVRELEMLSVLEREKGE